MDLIDKYLGEEKIDEIHGKGMAHVLDKIKGKDINKLKKLLKQKGIEFSISSKGQMVVGDDDFDDVEEIMVRKLGVF